jgi:UDP-N-acetylglucosamine--N-acetylmuramyl-(pentapeptide) pyrophosphoryl-undecaprenol N-acetylglucosamine transferase
MRVVIAGGGTGGHIYPAVAIADKIMRRRPDSEILFIGARRGMEKDIVPARGYELRLIDARGFDRRRLHRNIGVALALFRASRAVRKILRSFAPDAVIGTGGYVSGPVLREAGRAGIPAYIHEQNAFPGMANRMAERYAEKVFVAFAEGARYFKNKEMIVVTGNPVRRGFAVRGLVDYREKLGIEPHEFALLVFGGSLGARAVNGTLFAILRELWAENDLRLFFISGERHYGEARAAFAARGLSGEGRFRLLAYTDEMHAYMAAADLVISRSGALTVSEITACGRASILIPSPNVTGNHQFFNAKSVADRGGALLIEEKELSPARLLDAVLRLKNNKALLNGMSAASESLGCTDAADIIYEHIAAGKAAGPARRADNRQKHGRE